MKAFACAIDAAVVVLGNERTTTGFPHFHQCGAAIKIHGAQCRGSKLNSKPSCFSPPKSKFCDVKILLFCPPQDSPLYAEHLHVGRRSSFREQRCLFHACRILPQLFSEKKSLRFYHHHHHLQKFHSRLWTFFSLCRDYFQPTHKCQML